MKKVQKVLFWLGCVIIISLIVFFLVTELSNNTNNAAEEVPKAELSPKSTFIVKEYNGKVAVFELSNPEPTRITDVDLFDLPQEDRKLLYAGIVAENIEELSQILEDYCS